MTEITAKTSSALWPNTRLTARLSRAGRAERYAIDPVAFFLALLGGPILFTLATFWLFFIPVAALILGGLPYLMIGTPVLLIYLSRRPAAPAPLAGLAMAVVGMLSAVLVSAVALSGDREAIAPVLGMLVFCIVFAGCWAASFGSLYRALVRAPFDKPIPSF